MRNRIYTPSTESVRQYEQEQRNKQRLLAYEYAVESHYLRGPDLLEINDYIETPYPVIVCRPTGSRVRRYRLREL